MLSFCLFCNLGVHYRGKGSNIFFIAVCELFLRTPVLWGVAQSRASLSLLFLSTGKTCRALGWGAGGGSLPLRRRSGELLSIFLKLSSEDDCVGRLSIFLAGASKDKMSLRSTLGQGPHFGGHTKALPAIVLSLMTPWFRGHQSLSGSFLGTQHRETC